MRAKLIAELVSATHETAAAATVATTYVEAERLLLPSSNKTTALVLDALIREAPDNTLITKLARGVLDARQHGRWASTQENLVVLAAMRRYFDTYEKTTPNYTGKLWFGNAAYAEQPFVGHTQRARRCPRRLDVARAGLRARRRARQGRPRPDVLPRRHHLRAEARRPTRARCRLHRAPQLRGGRRSERRRARPRRPLARQARRTRGRDHRVAEHDDRVTRSRSSIRCPPASRR